MWNDNSDLFFLFESDDDEEKKKNKKEDEEEKESEKKKDSDDEEDDYNDLMNDNDSKEEDIDDNKEELSDDYNDLDSSSDDDTDFSLDDDDNDSKDDDSSDDYNTLVVVKTDNDNSSECCGSLYDKAAKVAYAYTVISNNLRHIHINACGDKFADIHNVADSIHCHFVYSLDYFYELAAQSPLIELDNPIRAKEHCEDIEVENEKDYDFRNAFEAIDKNLNYAIKYLNDLRDCANTRKDVQSKIDEELGYINHQSKYIIRKKLYNPVPSSTVTPDVEMESYSYNNLF